MTTLELQKLGELGVATLALVGGIITLVLIFYIFRSVFNRLMIEDKSQGEWQSAIVELAKTNSKQYTESVDSLKANVDVQKQLTAYLAKLGDSLQRTELAATNSSEATEANTKQIETLLQKTVAMEVGMGQNVDSARRDVNDHIDVIAKQILKELGQVRTEIADIKTIVSAPPTAPQTQVNADVDKAMARLNSIEALLETLIRQEKSKNET